jgi:hypothetical protein
MSEESPSHGSRANQNPRNFREAFTLVVRVWRYSRETIEQTTDWRAEISVINSESSSTHYAVGSKEIVIAVSDLLESRIKP